MADNIVLTGSGEGGHFYPALSVAQEIKRRNPATNLVFIGTGSEIEVNVAPRAGIPIRFIQADRFSPNPRNFLKPSIVDNTGLTQALTLLRKQNPGVVVSFGGLAASPVLSAAKMLDIPYIIFEQNLVPGRVNRMMARKALKILIGYEETREFFPSSKTVVTGVPVRRDILKRTRRAALKKLHLAPDKFTVFITGAFQGARSINNAVLKALPVWKNMDWQILHLVGRNHLAEIIPIAEPLMREAPCTYACIEYTDDIASLYAVSHLLVGRAGASTMAELTSRGLPAVLVPYPHTPDNQQEMNACWLELMGGGLVLPDGEVEAGLENMVLELAKDEKFRKKLAKKSKAAGCPDALENVVNEIDKVF